MVLFITITSLSLLFQLIAAVMALRLMRVSGVRYIWMLLATALVLMALRRGIVITHAFAGLAPGPVDFVIESSGLIVSILFVWGITAIGPLINEIVREKFRQQHHQEELQQILDFIPAIIVYKDREGRVLRANRAFADSRGLPFRAVIGRLTDELFPPDEAIKRLTDDRAVMEQGVPHLNIIESYGSSEGIHWARTHKMPYVNSRGEITGIIAVAEDITDLKQSEENLNRMNRMLRLLNACNQEMVRATDAGMLLGTVSRAIVSLGGYAGAWIVTVDGDTLDLRTRSGRATAFPAEELTADAMPRRCLDARAVVEYQSPESPLASLRALEPTVTCLALPLLAQDTAFGVLTVLLPPGEINDHDERIFLDELVLDLSHALFTLHLQAQQRKATDALQASECQLRQIIDLVPHMIFVKDRDGRFLLVNRAMAEMYGTTVEAMTGQAQRAVHPVAEEVDRFLQDDAATLAGGRPSVIPELPFTDIHGECHYLHAVNIPFATPLSDDLAILGVEVDITALKKATAALQLDEMRLHALLQLSEMTANTLKEVTEFTLEEGVRLTQSTIGYLAFLNEEETVLTMHSWSRSAMDECAINDKPINYPVESTGLWGEAIRQRKAIITNDYAAESPWKRGYPAGHVQVRCHMNVPIIDNGRIVALIGVGNKSTPYDDFDVLQLQLLVSGMWRLLQHRKAEEMLRALNEELEERVLDRTAQLEAVNTELLRSNAELQQFAYVASHDLQEPLRMVVSYLQLLERRYSGKLDQDADDFIGFAVDGASRMQRLINDLLTYSRVGMRTITPTQIDAALPLAQAIANLRMTIEEMGAIITQDPLPYVWADMGQLVQLFQNLLANAVKFHRDGVPPVVHVSARVLDGMVEITVADNGIGLDMQFADRIFGIFQRLHGKGDYPGTGIGLAVCKRIVERHGGAIRVESIPGVGTTFYFTIPVYGEVTHGTPELGAD